MLVENGGTVVIGGIFEMTESNDESRIPVLGEVPYVGALFRTRDRTFNKTEMLVFITPKMITDRNAALMTRGDWRVGAPTIALVGLPGLGESPPSGGGSGQRLGWRFVDSDHLHRRPHRVLDPRVFRTRGRRRASVTSSSRCWPI